MNNIRSYLFAGLLVMSLSSCDHYLEVKTYGQKLPDTEEDYATLLASQLTTFETYNDKTFGSPSLTLRNECFSDNLNASLLTKTQTLMPMYVGDQISSTQYRYNEVYSCIKDYNIIIDNLEQRDSELGKKLLGTSYAMRGALYFHLMRECCEAYDADRSWQIAGVPLVEHFDMEAKPGRGTIQDVIDFIERDLKTAIDYNMTDEKFHFTADVARAYLARDYFWGQQWENAITVAKEVLEKYPLLSGSDYVNMIQSEKDRIGNVILKSYYTTSSTATRNYRNYITYSKYRPLDIRLLNLFAEGKRDIRYASFLDKDFLNAKGFNFRVRSAEMCLIIAESYAHLGQAGEALRYLNMLRENRISGYKPLTETTLPAVNPDNLIKVDATGAPLTPLMQAILDERRKEFMMEGDRWYELKRNGSPEFWVGYEGVKYHTEKYLYTYPVSPRDLILNPNLVQNPGY